ncbi:VanZ family protein [Amycolatopsis minnesotensis]
MDALLRGFGVMIPISLTALPLAMFAWPFVTMLRRRRHPLRTASLTAAADVVIALAAGLALALVTVPVGDSRRSVLHLVPGADIRDALGGGSLWQVAGNVLLLAPIGLLLPLRLGRARSLPLVAGCALLLSVLVESLQFLIHAGRVTSADDVLLNTIGAAAGAATSRPWWRPRARHAAAAIPLPRRPMPSAVPCPPVRPVRSCARPIWPPTSSTRNVLWLPPAPARPGSTGSAVRRTTTYVLSSSGARKVSAHRVLPPGSPAVVPSPRRGGGP